MATNTIKNIRKTILCRSVVEGGGKCNGKGCRFAHTVDELYPRLCRYGDKCNRHKDHPRTCIFVHPDEDIFDYVTTHGFIGQPCVSPPPIVRAVKINGFVNPVQATDPVRTQLSREFYLSTADWDDLSSTISTPHDFDLEIGSPITISDLDMGNPVELDDSFNNDWPLPLVFSSKPSPLSVMDF